MAQLRRGCPPLWPLSLHASHLVLNRHHPPPVPRSACPPPQVRALFAVAAHVAPSVIFIDEVDSLLSARKADGKWEAARGKTWGQRVALVSCRLATLSAWAAQCRLTAPLLCAYLPASPASPPPAQASTSPCGG